MTPYNPMIKPGVLEVYCGPMRSGKTMELIHRVEKLHYMENCSYLFFKPALDTRDTQIRTRFNNIKLDCITIGEDTESLLGHIGINCKIVALDEAQFFSPKIVPVVERMLKDNLNVLVSGLDLDFRGEPFGPMPTLLSMAYEVHKMIAVCEYEGCNAPATRTQRLINKQPASYYSPTVLVENYSASESYEARCLQHHFVKDKPQTYF